MVGIYVYMSERALCFCYLIAAKWIMAGAGAHFDRISENTQFEFCFLYICGKLIYQLFWSMLKYCFWYILNEKKKNACRLWSHGGYSSHILSGIYPSYIISVHISHIHNIYAIDKYIHKYPPPTLFNKQSENNTNISSATALMETAHIPQGERSPRTPNTISLSRHRSNNARGLQTTNPLSEGKVAPSCLVHHKQRTSRKVTCEKHTL